MDLVRVDTTADSDGSDTVTVNLFIPHIIVRVPTAKRADFRFVIRLFDENQEHLLQFDRNPVAPLSMQVTDDRRLIRGVWATKRQGPQLQIFDIKNDKYLFYNLDLETAPP